MPVKKMALVILWRFFGVWKMMMSNQKQIELDEIKKLFRSG